MRKKRIAVVANPQAAGGRAQRAIARAVDFFEANHIEVTLWVEHDATALAATMRSGLNDSFDAVVALGGDGTVHLALNAVTPTHPALGVIPVGTGNDIAASWGIPLDTDTALRYIVSALDAPCRLVDLAEARHHSLTSRFAAVYSAGFDAIVNERANRMRFPKGSSRYTVALLAELTRLTPRRYQLNVDGLERVVDALLIAVANGPSFGGGMQIVPDASVDDGAVDVFIVHPVSRAQFITLYPRVFSGSHVSHPAVEIVRAKAVRISAPDIVGYADGERQESLPVEITVQPQALPILASPAFGH